MQTARSPFCGAGAVAGLKLVASALRLQEKTINAYSFAIDLPVFIRETKDYFGKTTASGHDPAAMIENSTNGHELSPAGILAWNSNFLFDPVWR